MTANDLVFVLTLPLAVAGLGLVHSLARRRMTRKVVTESVLIEEPCSFRFFHLKINPATEERFDPESDTRPSIVASSITRFLTDDLEQRFAVTVHARKIWTFLGQDLSGTGNPDMPDFVIPVSRATSVSVRSDQNFSSQEFITKGACESIFYLRVVAYTTRAGSRAFFIFEAVVEAGDDILVRCGVAPGLVIWGEPQAGNLNFLPDRRSVDATVACRSYANHLLNRFCALYF
jgi:hypothetical protein